MITLKEILDKEKWNSYIIDSDFEFYTFLQSWDWGEVQKSLWKGIVRYWIFEGKKQIWCFLLLKVEARRGNYYFIPHGPLVYWSDEKFFNVLPVITSILKKSAQQERFSFIRMNPPIANTVSNKTKFSISWFINAPMHENVEDTHLLDISLGQEELLKNMKKWDRYYINRAIKEWVEIQVGNSPEQKQTLIDMHEAHSKRENWKNTYTAFSQSFTQSLYKHFWDNITTVSASFEWKVESILMTIRFWKTCVYYIAASDIVHGKFSPNYLCQWEAIKKAQDDWCSVYNFWWVSPDNNPKHPIAWVSKFKRKFAGYDYSLLHAQDFVVSPKYWWNYLLETIRRKKRGYYYKKPSK